MVGGIDAVRGNVFPISSRSSSVFAAVESSEAAFKFPAELCELGGTGCVVFFQKPKSLVDHFTRRIVAAGTDFYL